MWILLVMNESNFGKKKYCTNIYMYINLTVDINSYERI